MGHSAAGSSFWEKSILWVWRVGAACYFAILFYTVFFAGRRRVDEGPSDGGTGTLHLVPFGRKWDMWVRNEELDALYLDVMGNVVMFVPLPLVLYVVFKIKSLRLVLLIGFLTSLSIETIQYVLNIGVSDMDDLIFNTLGTLIGVMIIAALLLRLREDAPENV